MAGGSAADLDDVIDASGVDLEDLMDELLNGDNGEGQDATDAKIEASGRREYLEAVMAAVEQDAKREGVLFFDCETVPDETRFPRPKMPEPIAMGEELDKLLANPKTTVDWIKDALRKNLVLEEIEKIERHERAGKNRAGVLDACQSARGGGNPEFDEWRKLSLSPIGCRITAFGWSVGKGPVRSFVVTTDDEERLLLKSWWLLVDGADRQHCGFNTLSFDVGVLGFRSLILGVKPSKALNRSRYSNREAIDLYLRLFPNGSPGGCDCKSICRALGIEIPAGDMDGSKVLDLWDIQDFEGIGRYVESDVTIERELFYRTADVFGA